MAKITAAGSYGTGFVKVVCEGVDGNYRLIFNGKENVDLETALRMELLTSHPVGGTYYPPEDSLLNVFAVLSWYFFRTKRPFMEIEGDIGRIPYEDGMIY